MRLYRIAAIMLAALAVMAAVYVLLKDNIGKGDGEEEYKSTYEKLYDIKIDDVIKVTVKNSVTNEFFAIEKDAEDKNKWNLISHGDLRVDSSKVKSIALNANSVGSSKVIEEDAQDLSKYGLDNPSLVTVYTGEGAAAFLEIGDMTPTEGAYYIKLKDSTKVYTLDTYSGDRLMVSENDIRDKKLFDVVQDEIIQISMDRKGENVFKAEKVDETRWNLTSPIIANVVYSAVGPLLQSVETLAVEEFVEKDAMSLDKYGLDKPNYVIEFKKAGDSSIQIMFGKEKAKKAFIKLGEDNEVFSVSTDAFTYLDKPIEEIVEVFAYIVNINDVSRIEVEMDGYKHDIGLQTDEEDRDNDKFTVNGKDASMEDENGDQPFRKYYQALIGVTLDEVYPEGSPQGEAEITFTYYLKEAPGVMKVEYISKDDTYYYVVKNGEYSGILVKKNKFDKEDGVREMNEKLMDFLESKG